MRRSILASAVLAAGLSLSGCQMALLDPAGPVGAQEKDLIILAVLLMLIPVLPVIVMTIWFAWRYRASNTKATYAPDFEHSNRIEAVVWAIPTLIILVLGTVTWVSTHQLDPQAALKAHPAQANTKPVEVEVVSLDWKWLFIYPEQNIATVNELALPVGRPVHFRLTSATVMNAFFIPQLGSQIYTMTGMETQLNLRADRTGVFDGISSNYSGEGFAGMKFQAKAMDDAAFDAWVAKAKASAAPLDTAAYDLLAKREMQTGTAYYSGVDPMLFHKVLNNCTDGKLCTSDAMKMAAFKAKSPEQCGKPGKIVEAEASPTRIAPQPGRPTTPVKS